MMIVFASRSKAMAVKLASPIFRRSAADGAIVQQVLDDRTDFGTKWTRSGLGLHYFHLERSDLLFRW